MRMIRAIVRPERADPVVAALEAAGFPSLTKMDVFGRGRQVGIKIGDVHYDELPKTMLLITVTEDDVERVIEVISEAARTGQFGDGKIFMTPVEEAYTIRTGDRGL